MSHYEHVESVLPIDWMGQEPSGRRPASPVQESREETINAVQVREEMAGGRPHSGVCNVEAFYWNWGRYSVSSFAWSKFNYCNFFFFVSQDWSDLAHVHDSCSFPRLCMSHVSPRVMVFKLGSAGPWEGLGGDSGSLQEVLRKDGWETKGQFLIPPPHSLHSQFCFYWFCVRFHIRFCLKKAV